MYVLIMKTLKSLLQRQDICAAINQPHTARVAKFNDNIMFDGSVYSRNIPCFAHSAHAIEIIAYFDKIEL